MFVEQSFCLLKSEAYLLGKTKYIERCIGESGLEVIEVWKISLGFRDVFRMYQDWIPRITMTLRFLPLIYLDLFIVQGTGAIRRMRDLKYQLRREMWGVKAGGFVHTPDTTVEFHDHMAIMEARRVG